MSEPARELDVEDARRGVRTHLIIEGERMPVIIPGSVIDALGVFAAVLTSGQVATALPVLIPEAMPWARVLPPADLQIFASELAEAAAGGRGAPGLLATLMREWRATADVYADPSLLTALTAPIDDHGPVPVPAG